jgi:hypothetical protein
MVETRDYTRAPLSRAELAKAGPWLRGGLGVALIAYSALSTIDGVRADCGPLCEGVVYGLPLGLLIGVLVAALLSLGQWLTSEHWRFAYAVLLLIDARYSQRWLDDWLVPVTQHNIASDAGLAMSAGLVLSWVGAVAIAMFGELLLFGRRSAR